MPIEQADFTLRSPQSAALSSDDFKHTTVLIIDDDPVYRMLLRDVCHKLKIGTIVEATDGEQGLGCVEAIKPDLIFLDIMMPGLDGIAVCRALRDMPVTADTAILIQTGVTDEAKRLEGFQAGATDYITKPLQIPEFTARTKTHLRNALYARHLSEFRARIDGHLNIANRFLTALLPDAQAARELAARNGFELTIAQRKHEEIGADLWYLHEISPGKLLLIILDPNASGLTGAINALRVDTVLREIWRTIHDPQQLLRALDFVMAESPCGRLFASVTAAVIDRHEGTIWYTSSGNPYPVLCQNQQVTALVSGGLPLGSGMASLDLHQATMEPHDILVLHSDGWPIKGLSTPLDLISQALATGLVDATDLIAAMPHTNDDATIITLKRMR